MGERKASEVFVECLRAEGVRYVFGIPGPGATNLVTAVADAFLDRAPLVALTGQSDLERMHKESHQYIDLIGIMRPVVKWNARVSSPEIVPEVVRKAFKVAESEKPDPPTWSCPRT